MDIVIEKVKQLELNLLEILPDYINNLNKLISVTEDSDYKTNLGYKIQESEDLFNSIDSF